MQTPPKQFREKSTDPCPKCGAFPFAGAKDCPACGLIFSRWEALAKAEPIAGSKLLEAAWQRVLESWQDPQSHEEFIQLCSKEKNLPFGALKYRRILDADPTNEEALKRKDQLIRLVLVHFMLDPNKQTS